jgi:hypothetical protein
MEICVFGASSKDTKQEYIDSVENMGEFFGKKGHNLIFGAGISGLMGAAARGFKRGGGKIHGVVPEFFKQDLSSFVNWQCDKLTVTPTMRERKAVMEDEADCFIIVPGGVGTFEEFFEVITLKQLGQHRKPIAIYNVNGYYNSLNNAIENGIIEDFIKPEFRSLYKLFTDLDEMLDYLENDDMNGLTIDYLK